MSIVFARARKMAARIALLSVGMLFVTAPVHAAGDGGFVAGVKPFERPAGAPEIKAAKHRKGWQAKALHGVSKPHPKHVLQFMDDQGHWFNPFTRAGMVDKYDVRRWHATPSSK